jgi:hypothetical protein
LEIIAAIAKLALPEPVSQLLSLHWMLDDSGCAHDLNDLDNLAQLLHSWAPDIASKAEWIQKEMLWSAAQGAHKDNTRKWAFRGLMLDTWVSVMTELGVPPSDATAAISAIELTVLKSFPAIWVTFSELTHDGRDSERHRKSLDFAVEAFFLDWAKDQGPMPITRHEVSALTARAKRKWLTTRKRELKKLRNAHGRSNTSQPLITGFLLQPPQPNPALMASIRAASYLQVVSRTVKRKRKRLMQTLLRDYDIAPGALQELQQRQESSPRPRGPRVPDPGPPPVILPNPPRVSRRHPILAVRQPTLTPAQRRHQHRLRPSSSELEEFDRDVAFDESRLKDADWPPSDASEPYRDPLVAPQDSQFAVFDSDLCGD